MARKKIKLPESVMRRQRARRRAVQGVYQWQMTGTSSRDIITQFNDEQDMSNIDNDLFVFLLSTVISQSEELDEKLQKFLDRPIAQVDETERAILRIAAVELLQSIEVPAKVVLNEAIELAHRFGAEQSHAFINGVLDNAVAEWRKEEIEANRLCAVSADASIAESTKDAIEEPAEKPLKASTKK